jgi:hypothetical protein
VADLCTGGYAFANNEPSSGEAAAFAFDNDFAVYRWVGYNTSYPVDIWAVKALSSAATVISYQLVSGDDAPERDPADWVIQGSNDGTNWVTLDTQENQTFSGRISTNTYNFSNSIPYSYYRWYVHSLIYDDAPYFQITELRLWTGASGTGTNVAITGTHTSSANSYPGYNVNTLFDNSTATKWLCDNSAGSPVYSWWIGYRLPTAAAVNQYTVTSANDIPNRDPQDWKFQGSYDRTVWVDADTRTGEDFPSRSQTKTYSFTSIGSYPYWRLRITKRGDNATSGDLSIAEIEMEAIASAAGIANKYLKVNQAVRRAAYW